MWISSARLLTFLSCAALALGFMGWRGSLTGAAPREAASVREQLQAAVSLAVREGSLAWLDAGANEAGLRTALRWQRVVFLGAPTPEGRADVYSVSVRFAPGPRILAVRDLRNLTRTPDGDEYRMVSSGRRVGFATRVLGQVRTLTVLDFDGADARETGDFGRLDRLMSGVTDWFETGQFDGVGRTLMSFTMPPAEVEFDFVRGASGDGLVVGWVDRQGGPRSVVLGLDGISTGEDGDLVVARDTRAPKKPLIWLVDTVRDHSFVGPERIGRLEERFFAMRDALRRWRHRYLPGERGDAAALDEEYEQAMEESAEEFASTVPVDDEEAAWRRRDPFPWPPPRLGSPAFDEEEEREGQWSPGAPLWVRTLEEAPPAFYRTTLRVDADRPYLHTHIIAMDMRQLELRIVGGLANPRSTTGSRGSGRLPREPDILPRVVAAFNGAFKTIHGAYGMMEDRNILLLPVEEAATVAVMDDGRTYMGSWPVGAGIPADMMSYRQNLDPLIDGGVFNPRNRDRWGRTPYTSLTYMNTIRSGLCMDDNGTMFYVWGEDQTAETLGLAMDTIGCSYGMHLDMNPYHTSFLHYRFEDAGSQEILPEYRGVVSIRGMSFPPRTYVEGSLKDFFYLMLRDPGMEGWSAAGIVQPLPEFLPSIMRRELDGCTLVAVDTARVRMRLEPGSVPSRLALHLQEGLGDFGDVLAALSFGPWSKARGQMVDGTVVGGIDDGAPTLLVDAGGEAVLGGWPLEAERAERADRALEMIQGVDVSTASSPSGRLVAIGRYQERWLVMGEGEREALVAEFAALGVENALAAPAGADRAGLLLRGEQGLVDASGEQVHEIDVAPARLLVLERPARFGAARLEEIF